MPSLKAAGVALALAFASQASVAGVAQASLGGFGNLASATVRGGGGIVNFYSPFSDYSASASNGATSQTSNLSPSNWDIRSVVAQANPGGNVATAGNTNGIGGGDNPPFLMIDSTGVFANATSSPYQMAGVGPTTESTASAFREGTFNILDPFTFETVGGIIDFTFSYSLLANTIAGLDTAEASVILSFFNLANGSAQTFFDNVLGAGTRNGTFTYSMTLGADDLGYVSMSALASAISQVPEPGILLLVGSGLVGLAFVRRRRSGGADGAAA
jgi:hypothetical protein